MKAEDLVKRFDAMSEELSAAAWKMAHDPSEDLLIACAAEEELVATQLSIDGFTDFDDKFSLDEWNEQIAFCFDDTPIWFIGVAFPFSIPNKLNFIAVVALDSMTASYTQIIVSVQNGKKKPVRWEPLMPFPILNELIVTLRHHVTPQG